jgi:hypothetical protein
MAALQVLLAVVQALEAAGIPYMIVGSFSSNLYGRTRSTHDADLIVEMGDRTVGALAPLLGPEFQIDSQTSFETVTGTMRNHLRHAASQFLVELFELSRDPHDQERFARRRRAIMGGVSVWVPTAEDVVITKLRWSRGGNREKDVDDVLGVLAMQSESLDFDYVRHWCSEHGTLPVLEQLLVSLKR